MVTCSFLLADTPRLQMAASPTGGNLFHQISLCAFQKSMPNCENHHPSLPQWWSLGSWANACSVGDSELTLTNQPHIFSLFSCSHYPKYTSKRGSPNWNGLCYQLWLTLKHMANKAAMIYCSGRELCLQQWMGFLLAYHLRLSLLLFYFHDFPTRMGYCCPCINSPWMKPFSPTISNSLSFN